jgi:hypothetical protein
LLYLTESNATGLGVTKCDPSAGMILQYTEIQPLAKFSAPRQIAAVLLIPTFNAETLKLIPARISIMAIEWF